MHSIFILGRQPAIGRAELESLFGGQHVTTAGPQAALVDVSAATVAFERIGGSTRLGEVLGIAAYTSWPSLQREFTRLGVAAAQAIGEGKIQLGLSAFGLDIPPRTLGGAGLELKKVLKKAGRSVRLVPNQEPALSSAQVLHNHLTGERGLELLLVRDGQRVIIARTVRVQDITAYAERDQKRPKRDARVGMLPPKLAQTIVNLAVADANPHHGGIVLDPFCGTGVVLQEAQLMGFDVYGTDLEPRMISFTKQNLDWLQTGHLGHPPLTHGQAAARQTNAASQYPPLEAGDATSHTWHNPKAIRFVASEAYLGRPLASWPEPPVLQEIVMNCNTIIEKFLRNIHAQLQPGSRLCLALPAWISPSGRIKHLPLLDRVGDLGYNRVSFVTVDDTELVYHREGQIVGRELLVITRK